MFYFYNIKKNIHQSKNAQQMAKQKGHIKYVGTLGEVRHFKIKGQEGFFAGLVGGPTAEQVLHNATL